MKSSSISLDADDLMVGVSVEIEFLLIPLQGVLLDPLKAGEFSQTDSSNGSIPEMFHET